jgi:hypothetical protein
MNNPIPIYEGPIAVLDMLGFKEYVHNHTIQSVIDEYAHIITSTSLSAEIINAQLEFMVYSDTIAIRLIDISEEGFLNFIKVLQQIVNQYFTKCRIPGTDPIPLRGAISFGEYSWHKGDISTQVFNRKPVTCKNINFIVGKAIVDAHELESKQAWIATSFTKTVGDNFQEQYPNAFKALEESKYFCKYNIPTRNEPISGYVINPTERSMFKHSFDAFCAICKKYVLGDYVFDVKTKYVNTLNLLKNIHDKNNLFPLWPEHLLKQTSKVQINLRDFELVNKKYNEEKNKIHR